MRNKLCDKTSIMQMLIIFSLPS